MAGPNHNDNWRIIVMAEPFQQIGTAAVNVLARVEAQAECHSRRLVIPTLPMRWRDIAQEKQLSTNSAAKA
jgi:hypothetical protein